MRIIKIVSEINGAHDNFTSNMSFVPNGYAVIPNDMETPNFPFGEIEVEEVDGVMTVTKWIPGTIPEVEETDKPITELEQLRADIDYIAVMTGVDL